MAETLLLEYVPQSFFNASYFYTESEELLSTPADRLDGCSVRKLVYLWTCKLLEL